MPILLGTLPSICGTGIMWLFIHWHYQSTLSIINFSLLYFSITSITMSFALTPTTMVAITAGFLFGWGSFPLLVSSYLIAAFLSAYTNHYLLFKIIKYRPDKDHSIAPMLKYFEGNYFLLVALMRLSPIIPFAITNYLLSSLPLKKISYLSASFLGMLPRTAVVFWAGTEASNILEYLKHPSLSGSLQFVPLALVAISTAGLIIITKKALAKAKAHQ